MQVLLNSLFLLVEDTKTESIFKTFSLMKALA